MSGHLVQQSETGTLLGFCDADGDSSPILFRRRRDAELLAAALNLADASPHRWEAVEAPDTPGDNR